ncbi:MAG: hypothetical protein H6710_20765 [Myxococcales bacterium]|nr:hypothetical protein [Myxococcales bacterium]MCB9706502.1 hypothetical protein [Myxococcales bacterium]
MERRSPLRIAVEGLTEGRMAAARGALEEALDALGRGLAALGPIRRQGVLDPLGLRLALAVRAQAEGRLAAAVAEMEEILEEGIAEYEGRDGVRS